MACEAAAVILGSEAAPRDTAAIKTMLDGIVMVGASFSTEYHVSVEEVIEPCMRYREQLQVREMCQLGTTQFKELLARMAACQKATRTGVCAVVTKPPETILVYLAPDGTPALFDSHERPHHDGAAYVTFADMAELQAYLESLFSVPSVRLSEDFSGFGPSSTARCTGTQSQTAHIAAEESGTGEGDE